jgi:pimeloyl-ACP methyl ester carboxylesterase
VRLITGKIYNGIWYSRSHLPLIFERFTEKQFHSAEAILSYVEGPSNGAPIVLIHGVGSHWQPFQPILPILAEKHHVYALDLRWHGIIPSMLLPQMIKGLLMLVIGKQESPDVV